MTKLEILTYYSFRYSYDYSTTTTTHYIVVLYSHWGKKSEKKKEKRGGRKKNNNNIDADTFVPEKKEKQRKKVRK